MKNEAAVVEVAGYEKTVGVCGRLLNEGVAFYVEPINLVEKTARTEGDHFYDFKCRIFVRTQDAKTLTMLCKESE